MKRTLIAGLLVTMLVLVSCTGNTDTAASKEIDDNKAVADVTNVNVITPTSELDTSENKKDAEMDVNYESEPDNSSEAASKDHDIVQPAEMSEYSEDASDHYDQDVVSGYMSLSQKDFDDAPAFDDYEANDSGEANLFIVKLAEYKDEEIAVYGVKEGVIISYEGKKEFFPCGWQDIRPSHTIALCDMDADGSDELVIVTNAAQGTACLSTEIFSECLSLGKMKI